jgi:NADH dehydrogenase FAD-containing subunit
MATKKRVVVVGGGVGGSTVAKKLEQEADVTLIDPYVRLLLFPLNAMLNLAHLSCDLQKPTEPKKTRIQKNLTKAIFFIPSEPS